MSEEPSPVERADERLESEPVDRSAERKERDGAAGPTAPDERIVSLDALRGFALLGILVVNVWFFGLPMAGVMAPPTFGDFSGANYAAWLVSHVFFEMKFMTLFTLLFGAGIVLFTESKERRESPAVRLHYRRTFWLLLIGLGHAYLLWYGDVLVSYALCALAVVFVRGWSPRRLATVGLVLVAVPSLLFVSMGLLALDAPAEDVEAIEDEMLAGQGATERAVQAELEAYRGGWLEQMDHRVRTALEFQTFEFAFTTFWRVSGLMLLGMALYKWGVLSSDRSARFYRRMLAVGGIVGLSLTLAGVWYVELVDWNPIRRLTIGTQFNYWGSLPLAGAYVAAVMLWCRNRADGPVTGALAAVGRTAFSNYLLQTVLATSIFYGHGLGLFGSLSRVELLGVVVVIWTVQIPLSVLWLRRFRFGPAEWLWRTLTYGERQPMRER